MEERRIAAIVLFVLALIVLIFTVILPFINKKRTHTISFKTCKFDFKYRYDVDTADDWFIVAQHHLALCLCKVYTKKYDTATSRQIMKIYKQYGTPIILDSIENSRYKNIDSVLKYKNKAFNYTPDD